MLKNTDDYKSLSIEDTLKNRAYKMLQGDKIVDNLNP